MFRSLLPQGHNRVGQKGAGHDGSTDDGSAHNWSIPRAAHNRRGVPAASIASGDGSAAFEDVAVSIGIG